MITPTAPRTKLTINQNLALGFTLTGIRPEWDTPKNRTKLTQLGDTGYFPHATDFAHIIRAAVWYATHTSAAEFADENKLIGDPAYHSITLFPNNGPWWTETR